jgi:hypothetical protein
MIKQIEKTYHFILPRRNRLSQSAGLLIAALIISTTVHALVTAAQTQQPVRKQRFTAAGKAEAFTWQKRCREKLFELMMGGGRTETIPLSPQIVRREHVPAGGYWLQEITLASLTDRRLHAWVALPNVKKAQVGAVLALHGHGGSGEQVVRGQGLYWYGRALSEMGYVVISPDIGQHELQHADWSLMGERVWDAVRCIDYLVTLPEVDKTRIAVAGLSLGGETAMYVAALDERIQAACSSGWLTTIENMKQGHCPCWNFPGLEEHFDFADIFACVAPRPLVLEIGEKEKAPGGFPVEIARPAFAEIQAAYSIFGAQDDLTLDIHPGGHVFHGTHFWGPLRKALGAPWPWKDRDAEGRRPAPKPSDTAELERRGEIARRCFSRALGVVDGWWATRDAETGLYPRRLDEPVWAPQDNAADMLPFLALTAHFLAPERLPEILEIIPKEKTLTNRLGPLPDWYSLADRRFVHEAADLNRSIFGAAEYCKDGLIPMTEVMGRGPWTERMIELLDGIFARVAVSTEFGALPADDSEVNGDLLQALARVYCLTREPKYLQWAERIGDAYCFEILPRNGGLPPHRWNFATHQATGDTLNLNDHGNEIIGGLAELYVVTKTFHPEKAAQYHEPLSRMFHRLLERARNADGLWFNLLRASTAEVLRPETPDTWGYALSAAVTFGRAAEDETLIDAAKLALQNIDRPHYLDWNGADSYADSIEGALYLLNRFAVQEGFDWLEKILPLFLGKQRDDGIVEGWYGDGNYARTALLAGLYFTQGIIPRPWRRDLKIGALTSGKTLEIMVWTDGPWEGKVCFDTRRHQRHLRLPINYPRLNEFPEWFTVAEDAHYHLRLNNGKIELKTGKELIEGYPVRLTRGGSFFVTIESR